MKAILPLLLLLSAASIQAASHYVLRSASGTRDGSDWVNAFTNLPTSLTRGDTYYVGDGVYTAAYLNDAVSGGTLITVQKATVASHGTDTGWSAAFGDGQAVFTNTFYVLKSNYLVDGVTGGGPGSWTNGFGFFFDGRVNTAGVVCYVDSGCTNVIVRHFEILGAGDDGTGNGCDGINHAYVTNVFMSDWYVRNMGRTIIFSRGHGLTFSNFYSGNFESTAGEHAEFASIQPDYADPVTNVTFINGIITHIEGTGGILGTYDSLKVINVVFDPVNGEGGANGYIATWTGSQMTRAQIYNCTFLGGSTLFFNFGAAVASGNVFSNNLVMGAYISPWSLNACVHDYNAYGSGITGDFTDTYAEANVQTNIQSSIFMDYAGHDFRLATNTAAGIVTPYTKDIMGVSKSYRDRGAYEYVPASASAAPAAITLTGQQTWSGGVRFQ